MDFDVDDPSRVEIYNGYSSYGTEKFDIVAGVNTFEFKESNYGSNIYIAATEGNIVKTCVSSTAKTSLTVRAEL